MKCRARDHSHARVLQAAELTAQDIVAAAATATGLLDEADYLYLVDRKKD